MKKSCVKFRRCSYVNHVINIIRLQIMRGAPHFQGISGIQGDTSGCSLGFVDIKAKFAIKYEEHVIKLNLCFDVN